MRLGRSVLLPFLRCDPTPRFSATTSFSHGITARRSTATLTPLIILFGCSIRQASFSYFLLSPCIYS